MFVVSGLRFEFAAFFGFGFLLKVSGFWFEVLVLAQKDVLLFLYQQIES
jgi:hypothetical protein